MTETGLHHDPINCAWQVDVRRQENDVLALQRSYAFMSGHEMKHDLLETALPLARGSGTWARIWSKLARFFVVSFVVMQEGYRASTGCVFAREHDGGGDFFHGEISDVAERTATRRATLKLWPTSGANNVSGLTL